MRRRTLVISILCLLLGVYFWRGSGGIDQVQVQVETNVEHLNKEVKEAGVRSQNEEEEDPVSAKWNRDVEERKKLLEAQRNKDLLNSQEKKEEVKEVKEENENEEDTTIEEIEERILRIEKEIEEKTREIGKIIGQEEIKDEENLKDHLNSHENKEENEEDEDKDEDEEQEEKDIKDHLNSHENEEDDEEQEDEDEENKNEENLKDHLNSHESKEENEDIKNEDEEDEDEEDEKEEDDKIEENVLNSLQRYQILRSPYTQNFRYSPCKSSPPSPAFNLQIPQTIPAQELMALDLIFNDASLNGDCSIALTLQFVGEDESKKKIEGFGKVNCDPENKKYIFALVLPIPGSYKLTLTSSFISCRSELGPTTLSSTTYIILATPPLVKMITPRCTLKDLTHNHIGYWYSQETCQLPHCTGTLLNWKRSPEKEIWSHFGCHLHFYSPEEIIQRLTGKTIMFLGDSTTTEFVESVLLTMGLDEDLIFQNMHEPSINYTETKKEFYLEILNTHRLMNVFSKKYNITFYHRFTGSEDIEGGFGGTRTFWTPGVLKWVNNLFRTDLYPKVDLIVFNSALHDHGIQTYAKTQSYPQDLQTLASLMKNFSREHDLKLLWKTTNPFDPLFVSQLYNDLANEVMKQNQIPIVETGGPAFGRNKVGGGYTDGNHYGFSAMHHKIQTITVQKMMTYIYITAILEVLES